MFSGCPINSASPVHGCPLNFLNAVKVQCFIKQILFIEAFKLETSNKN
jgi:hypothetical protein